MTVFNSDEYYYFMLLPYQNRWATKNYTSAMRRGVSHPGGRLSADQHCGGAHCNDIRRTNTNTHIPYH